MSSIVSIGTAVPENEITQEEFGSFLSKRMKADVVSGGDKVKALLRSTRIRKRYSVLPDFKPSSSGHELFFLNGAAPSTEARMAIYQEKALPLAAKASRKCLENAGLASGKVTHLITVSCTGFRAPGLEIELAEELGVPYTAERYAVNFMGCYAAFQALRMANDIVRSHPEAKILINCTELCTIHYQEKWDQDSLLSNALFGDGSASVLVTGEGDRIGNSFPPLFMEGFTSRIFRKGQSDMTWQIGSEGFLMRLSSYIPDLIDEGIDSLLEAALEDNGTSREEISLWAIHSGGRKILEVARDKLQLPDEGISSAMEVLEEYGNMSSPTILFVLEKMRRQLPIDGEKKKLFAVGFGPGLTMESAIFSTPE